MVKYVSMLVAAVVALSLGGCAHPYVSKAHAFRKELEAKDYDAASKMMAANPRIWYEKREGEGSAWTFGGGRWKVWDKEFNGTSVHEEWVPANRSVSSIAIETNDYFRMLERDPAPWLHTYFFNDEGLIEGQMISGVPEERDPGAGFRNEGRGDEFDAWYRKTYPKEYDYIRPNGKIDPTSDRALMTRSRLQEWREAVGLDNNR